ncbi:hypothetical protein ACFX11_038755 [Malus domestica]
MKVATRGAVHHNKVGDRGNASHDEISPPKRKTESQYTSKIAPLNPIVGLACVKLERHETLLSPPPAAQAIRLFVGHNNIIRDETPRDESTLIVRNKIWYTALKPIREALGSNLVQGIA